MFDDGVAALEGPMLAVGVDIGVDIGVVIGGGAIDDVDSLLIPASARNRLILAYGSSDGGKIAVCTFLPSSSFFLPPNQPENQPFLEPSIKNTHLAFDQR